MDYKTIMVHLELGRSNDGFLKIAAGLVDRFQAHVIGIAACQPMRPIYDDGSACFSGEVIAEDYRQLKIEIEEAEDAFRAVFSGRAQSVSWRSTITFLSLAEYIACEARAADLIVAGVNGSLPDNARNVHIGDLIMQVGRPALIVPPAVNELKLENVLVGWKGTRETRRAIADALPILKLAKQVSVMEIAAEGEIPRIRDDVQDVTAWLARHGIESDALVMPATGGDASNLGTIAREEGIDLLVAGAYGHNRLREWAFGGVTQDLLLNPDRCVLLSH